MSRNKTEVRKSQRCKSKESKSRKVQTKINKRRKKAETKRRERERTKADPAKYSEAKARERLRWHQGQQQGKVKTVHQMTDAERIKLSKRRKVSNRKYREKKKSERSS